MLLPRSRTRRLARGPLAAATLSWLLAGCGGAAPSPPVQKIPAPVLHLTGAAQSHLAIVVMENEEYGDIIGSLSTPYINGLARRSALASRMYSVTHPSLPNYLALTGGSTFGITDDCTGCSVPGAGLAGQFESRRIPWKAYMQGIPSPCWTGDGAGNYAKKHDPFLYYRVLLAQHRICRSHVVDLSALASDERTGLPRFVWITPDLCNDMHDCDPSVGDRFLSHLVPPLLRALGPHGLLFVTWDEGSTDDGCCRLAQGGHIAMLLAGDGARAGARMSTAVDHYSVLQAVEDIFGLPRLGGAACACTPSLAPLLRR